MTYAALEHTPLDPIGRACHPVTPGGAGRGEREWVERRALGDTVPAAGRVGCDGQVRSCAGGCGHAWSVYEGI